MEKLFEIHVSVHPKDILLFRLWALDNDVKAIGIIGEIPELTFSKYTNGTYEKAYNKSIALARNLTLNDITVTQIRIEAIFSSFDPNIDQHAKNNKSGYFEFHIKYHVVNSKDYNELINITKKFNEFHKNTGIYSFIGFNYFKKNVEPIVSLRVPSNFYIKGALEIKDVLINELKKSNFKTNEKIHKEYVYYDEPYNSKL